MHPEWALAVHANLPSRARWQSLGTMRPDWQRNGSQADIVLRYDEGNRVLSIVETSSLPEADQPAPVVLKFGSSVLRSVADLPRVAGELYRQRRAGHRVIAVVSALAGETDRLLVEAGVASGEARCRGVARLVSHGEERSAALLRIACDRIGLAATICSPEKLGLKARGEWLAAGPVALDPAALLAGLDETGLVIVPGFVGTGDDGERVLLGRGGSDFSAIFIAGEIGASCVRLLKDVDGVFDRDPATNTRALHYSEIHWNDALRVGGSLIQQQSIEYAAARRLPIEVGKIGGMHPTRVGARTVPPRAAVARRPLRVAIAGFGTVGQALAERLREEPGVEIAAILVRDVARARRVSPPIPPTADLRSFLDRDCDVVVDALSCEETGAFLCSAALPRGRHVVSASKRTIVAGLGRFSGLAAAHGVGLRYSAAVGGSACILETVDRARAAGTVSRFAGVLNGTVNFILDALHAGHPFDAAVDAARAAGFAEEDCDFDLSGADAAAKLRLVAQRAFGVDPGEIEVLVEALNEAAIARIAANGEPWRQLSTLVSTPAGIEARVSIEPVSKRPLLARVADEWNAAIIELDDGRRLRCEGRGAGGAATAEAITADLFDIVALLATALGEVATPTVPSAAAPMPVAV